MRSRSDSVEPIQPCLTGMDCSSMINPADAIRLGVPSGTSCNPEDDWCGAPDFNDVARLQWERCMLDSDLDFALELSIPKLPLCIPNLSARHKLPDVPKHRAVATKLTNIGGVLSAQPGKLTRWRSHYNIPRGATLLLHQESLDVFLAKIEGKIGSDQFFSLLQHLGGSLILASPGYSVYDDGCMCPLKQLANLRCSLLDAARANRAGIPAVPTLGWNKDRASDLEFLATWITRQQGKVKVLSVNAQTGTHSPDLCKELAEGMRTLERLCGSEFHWIVFGGRKRIEAMSGILPRGRMSQVCRPKDFQMPVRPKNGPLQIQYILDLKERPRRVSSND